jgi:pteridine reductase
MVDSVLITGAAKRIGRFLAEFLAKEGFEIILHYGTSQSDAVLVRQCIEAAGGKCHLVQADLSDPQAAAQVFENLRQHGIRVRYLIHNASLFEDIRFQTMNPSDWQRHLQVNLSTPVFLNQAFAAQLLKEESGRIIHLLDWRALRPGADHFPYTISKAALASVTQSLALALAPQIQVNGIAFGAILPPSDGGDIQKILETIPAKRWATLEEVGQTVLFLLTGPGYITGEIIHLDGGRHLL